MKKPAIPKMMPFFIPLMALTVFSNFPDATAQISLRLKSTGTTIGSLSPDPLSRVYLPSHPLDTLRISLFAGDERTESLILHNGGSEPYDFYTAYNGCDIHDPQNRAIRFDGVDDHILIYHSPSVNIIREITLEAWIRYDSGYSGVIPILSRGLLGYGYALYITEPDSGRHLGFRVSPGEFLSGETLHENQWYHVAVTYDSKMVILYINGIQDTAYYAGGSLSMADLDLYIGSNDPKMKPRGYFPGCMDEVRIWNIARNPRDINAFAHRALSGSEAGLVGYWTFNSQTLRAVMDRTGNRMGMMIGGACREVSTVPMGEKIHSYPVSYQLQPDSTLEMMIRIRAENLDRPDNYFNIEFFSADASVPDAVLPVHIQVLDAPSISINFDSVLWGYVDTYEMHSFDLLVNNYGTENLVIDSVCTDLKGTRISPASGTLAPGGNKKFTLELFLRERDSIQGSLCFHTNDPSDRVVKIPIRGIGDKPPYLNRWNLINDTLVSGQDMRVQKRITNPDGSSPVYLNCLVQTLSLPGESWDRIPKSDSSGWLKTSFPRSCCLDPGASMVFDITLDASGLEAGDYYGEMIVEGYNPATVYTKGIFRISLHVISAEEPLTDLGAGVSQIESDVKIFPNPSTGPLTIQTGKPGDHPVVIHAMNGQVMYRDIFYGSSMHLDISNFTEGIYLITVESEGRTDTRRIIKR